MHVVIFFLQIVMAPNKECTYMYIIFKALSSFLNMLNHKNYFIKCLITCGLMTQS